VRHTQDIVLARLRELGRRWRTGEATAGEASSRAVTQVLAEVEAVETAGSDTTAARLATPWRGVGCLLVAIAVVLATVAAFLSWPRPVDRLADAPVIDREVTGAWSSSPGEGATGWPSRAPNAPPTSGLPATIVVHVAGDVRQPGVVHLPAGSRVIDAVDAAGGLKRGGSVGAVNLARVLADGERVEVGSAVDAAAQATPGPSRASGSGSQLDLNSATAEQLDALPGIGPVTAAKILAWRSEHGRFTLVDELAEVSGIGPKTLEELRAHVRV
jgi:competence protein ComEA